MKRPSPACLHDAYAATYDQEVQAYGCYLQEALFGLSFEALQPGQRVLDAGIGSGLSAALFAKAGLQVYGFDFSPAMLEVCRAKGIARELKRHDLQQAPWPYPSAAFDHLVCCGVLHFIPDLEGVFHEAGRMLREGGWYVFTTKTPTSLDASGAKYERQSSGELDVFSHAPAYLTAIIDQAGFERIKVLKCFVGEEPFYAWVVQKCLTRSSP
jgi:predicted TPR repeat methyltransferase